MTSADVNSPADIKDVTTQSFAEDVIAASREVPVLVDFWAPWCGPCKQLTPILEGAVAKANGKVRLAKMNIDDYPEIAGQLGVRSIPAVFAFKDGQPLDGFMGAQSESQVMSFIERVAGPVGPTETEALLEEANALLADEDLQSAGRLFAQVAEMEPDNLKALSGLITVFVGLDELEQAQQILARIPVDQQNDSDVAAAVTALTLAEQAEDLGDLDELQKAVDGNPDDHQSRIDLAIGLAGKGDKSGAVDQLIESFKRDCEWNEAAARKQLLQFFEAWGPMDKDTLSGRRKLSSLLFS